SARGRPFSCTLFAGEPFARSPRLTIVRRWSPQPTEPQEIVMLKRTLVCTFTALAIATGGVVATAGAASAHGIHHHHKHYKHNKRGNYWYWKKHHKHGKWVWYKKYRKHG